MRNITGRATTPNTTVKTIDYTVEMQNCSGSNRLGTINMVPVKRGSCKPVHVFLYKLNSRDSSPIRRASQLRVFVLLFSFSVLVTAGHLNIK